MSTPARVADSLEAAIRAEQLAAILRARAAAEWARWYLSNCEPLRGAVPVLARLGFDGPPLPGLYVDRAGCIVLPAMVGRSVEQLVRVGHDGEHQACEGAALGGTSHTLDRAGATVTVVVQRFTDAIVAYRALNTCRVIVAWDARNCARIARTLSGLVGVPTDDLASLWLERSAEKEARRYRETVAQVRRAVDAEIADLLMRGAKWQTT